MKNVENYLKAEFDSLSINESLSRSVAAAFLVQMNPTLSELSDLKCAVSEAVTNCTVHAYENKIGKIILTLTSFSDRTVKITVSDKGKGIENLSLAMEPLYTTDAENERSGMGFTVMETFTDSLKVRSKPGKGTKVTMIKKLSPIR